MSYYHIMKSQSSWRDAGKFQVEKIPHIKVKANIKAWVEAHGTSPFSLYEVAAAVPHRTANSNTAIRSCVTALVASGFLTALRNDMYKKT
jgi:hypothetical protein